MTEPLRDRNATTKEQLLDAAERLIAEQGIDGASVRAITEAAGANIAAVNYHFGSKDGLVRAVFERRLLPINRERLDRLEQVVAQPGRPDIEGVVRAFVLPPFHYLRTDTAPSFGRCMIRALADPGQQMREVLLEVFGLVIESFVEALAAALPDESRESIYWRFHFMIGSMAYTIGMGHLVEEYSRGAAGPPDFDEIGERLVSFVTAGIRAGTGEPTP